MKKSMTIICAAVLAVALAACAGNGPGASQTPPAVTLKASEYKNEDFDTSGDIIIKTAQDVYESDTTEVSYTITNTTSTECIYGKPYSIEVLLGGTWYQVPFPEGTGWDKIALILKANTTNTESFKLSELDYKFMEGKFRLIKEIGGKVYFAEFQMTQVSAPSYAGSGY